MNRTRWLGSSVLLTALAACGQGEPPPAPAVPVLVVHPQPGTSAPPSWPGTIVAREEAALAFRVGGKLLRRDVDNGQRVRQGQRLAELDATDYALQAQAAQAQLAAAEAELARTRDEVQRYRALAAQQLISQSLLDAQLTAWQAAQSQRDAARAQLTVARNQADYAILRAPADGVIVSRLAEAGQVLAAGQPVYTLATDGAREAAIALPENQLGALAIGQSVAVELWNQPAQRWPGRVREIAAAADPLARTWAVRVQLDEAALDAVELGQSARVLARHADTALRIPLSAVQPGAGAGAGAQQHSVWVVETDGTVRARPVSLGGYGTDSVPVLSGLTPQDWVVAAGGHLLHEGQPVHARDRGNRPVQGD